MRFVIRQLGEGKTLTKYSSTLVYSIPYGPSAMVWGVSKNNAIWGLERCHDLLYTVDDMRRVSHIHCPRNGRVGFCSTNFRRIVLLDVQVLVTKMEAFLIVDSRV